MTALQGVLAERDKWSAVGQCAIEKTMSLVGTKSAMLLMREAYYGTTRFDAFAARVGMTEAVTAKRLRELVDAGLLERRPYQEPGQRTRHEYALTERGLDLMPALFALGQWGRRHLPHDGTPELSHAGCGAPVRVELRCTGGHRPSPDELVITR